MRNIYHSNIKAGKAAFLEKKGGVVTPFFIILYCLHPINQITNDHA
ncbi:MAG: hypothetical protein KDD10_28900 [Phaeodactylibacter sp.]|nr:hypothetical protein [Phaeodactylibacter sp.]MCB9294575.1 hypothetical protein [Lewinellaceae bacterium]